MKERYNNMKKIKVNFWCFMYIVMAKAMIWVIRHMKPGGERIDMLRKLSEMNNKLAVHTEAPNWFRTKLIFIYIDAIAIVREDTKYWNKKKEYINNLTKQLEEES